VFEYKKPVRIGNVRQDPNWREMYINGNSETLSELDVPLLVDDEVIGVINLESSTEDAFSQADEHCLMTLSGQAVLAIKNAQAYENQQYLLYERDTLNEIGNEIIAKLDSASVFGLILDKALEITGSTVGTLMLYDPQRNDLWMAAERGVVDAQKGERHSLDEGITGWVAQRKESLNIGDISEPPWNKVHLPFIPNVRSELVLLPKSF
jgi:GAF domain-containing protein